jgi:hypothetical protein
MSIFLGQLIGAILIATLVGLIFAVVVRKLFIGLSRRQSYLVGMPLAALACSIFYEAGTNHNFGINLYGLGIYGFGALVGCIVMILLSLLKSEEEPPVYQTVARDPRHSAQARRVEPQLGRRQPAEVVYDGAVRAAAPFAPRHPVRSEMPLASRPEARPLPKRGLNGWQRILLVLTALALVAFGILIPAFEVLSKPDEGEVSFGGTRYTIILDAETAKAVDADYANPNCAIYINAPVSTLCNPAETNCADPGGPRDLSAKETGGSCWQIYHFRTRDAALGRDIVPYTQKVLSDNQSAFLSDQKIARRWGFAGTVGLTWITILMGSGLLYLVGWSIGWIRRGFSGGE